MGATKTTTRSERHVRRCIRQGQYTCRGAAGAGLMLMLLLVLVQREQLHSIVNILIDCSARGLIC